MHVLACDMVADWSEQSAFNVEGTTGFTIISVMIKCTVVQSQVHMEKSLNTQPETSISRVV